MSSRRSSVPFPPADGLKKIGEEAIPSAPPPVIPAGECVATADFS
jgi:hypothetical protein